MYTKVRYRENILEISKIRSCNWNNFLYIDR